MSGMTTGAVMQTSLAMMFGMSLVGIIGSAMFLQLWKQCKCENYDVSIALFNLDNVGMTVVLIVSSVTLVTSLLALLFIDFYPALSSRIAKSKSSSDLSNEQPYWARAPPKNDDAVRVRVREDEAARARERVLQMVRRQNNDAPRGAPPPNIMSPSAIDAAPEKRAAGATLAMFPRLNNDVLDIWSRDPLPRGKTRLGERK